MRRFTKHQQAHLLSSLHSIQWLVEITWQNLVPVIVSPDTVPALEKIANKEIRRQCGILEQNI